MKKLTIIFITITIIIILLNTTLTIDSQNKIISIDINNINNNYNKKEIKKANNINTNNNNIELPIGKLIIKKININNNLYDINSKLNDIKYNIMINKSSILPDKDNSIMILQAHSGNSNISYFNRLNELEKNDEINLIINNIDYKYIVYKIYEAKKDYTIEYNQINNEKLLILTTCSTNDKTKQLIIYTKQK